MLKKKKYGFTLIEMIIVISLTLIVIAITSSIFITGNRVFSDSDVNTTLQMEAKDIQEKISDITMEANEVIVNGSTIKVMTYEEKVLIEQDGNNLLYSILDIDDNKKSSRILSANLNKFEITQSNNKSVNFNIELVKKKGFSEEDYNINFGIALRNK